MLLKQLIINKFDKVFIVCIIIPLFIALVVSLINGDSVDNIIRGIRLFFMPIIAPYLLYRTGFFRDVKIVWIERSLILLGVITVIYAIFQIYSYEGNLKQLWFYDYYYVEYGTNLVIKYNFNFLRGSSLRATSFFTSSIVLTTSLILPLILSAVKIYNSIAIKRFFYFSLFLLYSFGIYLTNTRVGYIMAVMSFFLMLFILIARRYKFYGLLFIPFLSIAVTFTMLLFSMTSDISALSRLVQLKSFMSYFKLLGLGVSNENVLVKFDSFYISTILMSGIFVLPYYFYYGYLAKKISTLNLKLSYNNHNKAIVLSLFLYSLALIYAFAFQYLAGSVSVKILYFLGFLVLALEEKKQLI